MGSRRPVVLSDFFEVNPKRAIKTGNESTFVSMADLAEHQRRISSWTRRSFKSGSRFQNGDVLVARITPCLENGKTAFVDILEEGAVGHGSTEFIVLAARDGVADPLFGYCLATSPRFRDYATSRMIGSSGRQRVSADEIGEYRLEYAPTLEEQRAIAAVLGAFDDYIESLFARAMLYDGMMQTVYQQLANERVERVRLGDVVEINPKTPLERGAEVPYFDMNSLPERGFLPASPTRRPYGSGTRFVPGDVLLARITPCLENGKTGIVPPVEGGIAWGSTEFIVLRASREIRGLVYGLSRSPEFRAYAIQHMIGSSGRQRVKAEDIARYRVPDLTSSGATSLGALAADWIEAGMAIRDQIETLANLRDALLPKLVSGEIQIGAPERFLDRAA